MRECNGEIWGYVPLEERCRYMLVASFLDMNIGASAFAERMGVSKRSLRAVVFGTSQISLRLFSNWCFALGYVPTFHLKAK